MASSKPTIYAYIGTFAQAEEQIRAGLEGIHIFRMQSPAAAWEPVQTVQGQLHPSFLAADPHGRYLYVVTRPEETEGVPGGAVSAFAIDPASGKLAYLNRQASHGFGPCYVSVERSGRYVLVANYRSGSVAMLPVRRDGRLGPASDFVQHVGSGPRSDRQEGPHAHCVIPDPSNRFALVADLGLDRVFVYRLDLERGKLVSNDPPFAALRPGAGPRHLAFHPNGRYLYVIDELDSTLTVCAWDGDRGALEPIQSVTTLPAGWAGENDPADVHLTPSGRFLYGSNRGHDSLAIYAVVEQTGLVELLGHQPTHGKCPRNFAIDPSGAFLFVANQDTDNIVAFRLDGETGRLAPTGQEIKATAPTCVQFVASR